MTHDEDQRQLMNAASGIVAAYVMNNELPAGEVPVLLRSVLDTLGRLTGDIEGVAGGPQPAIPIRHSIGEDYLSCLICGQRHKLLKRHLSSAHALSPDEYRAMFGLEAGYPMTAPAYSKRRARMARKIGLGRRSGGRNQAA